MPPAEYNPASTDALLATLLARQETDATSREEFRQEVRQRFDRGAARMDAQDRLLGDIHGRITRLEDSDVSRRLDILEAAEIATRADIIRAKTALWIIGGIVGVIQAIGLTFLNYFLTR